MSERNLVTFAGCIALIVALYGTKELALRLSRPWAAALFSAAAAAAVPVTWALDPDWNNPHVLPIAIYVGTPLTVLAVPVASFLFDLTRRPVWPCWPQVVIRTALELTLLLPACFVASLCLQLELGWVWI
jgi:hypothetical protein